MLAGNEVPAGDEVRGTSRTLGVLDLWEAPHNLGGELPHNSDHLDYLVKATGISSTLINRVEMNWISRGILSPASTF